MAFWVHFNLHANTKGHTLTRTQREGWVWQRGHTAVGCILHVVPARCQQRFKDGRTDTPAAPHAQPAKSAPGMRLLISALLFFYFFFLFFLLLCLPETFAFNFTVSFLHSYVALRPLGREPNRFGSFVVSLYRPNGVLQLPSISVGFFFFARLTYFFLMAHFVAVAVEWLTGLLATWWPVRWLTCWFAYAGQTSN